MFTGKIIFQHVFKSVCLHNWFAHITSMIIVSILTYILCVLCIKCVKGLMICQKLCNIVMRSSGNKV